MLFLRKVFLWPANQCTLHAFSNPVTEPSASSLLQLDFFYQELLTVPQIQPVYEVLLYFPLLLFNYKQPASVFVFRTRSCQSCLYGKQSIAEN